MRNLKRALSLALASVMLVGMMVVGTSAASFPDVTDEQNVEAIEVLNAVEVMIGDNGDFRPDDNVTRNEMAVIMAKLILGKDADSYSGTHPFTDVPEWADKYVAACYDEGIVAGRTETEYDGQATVTAQEAAAMMLRALGYEKLEKFGDGYPREIVKKANQISLFKDVGSNPTMPMTRNAVAQLSLNSLKATVVKATVTEPIEINGVKLPGEQKYEDATTKEFDYTATGAIPSDYSGTLQLCEKLYGNDLKLVTTGQTDDMGRPATAWTLKGESDPIYKAAKEADYTVTLEKAPGSNIQDLLDLAKKNVGKTTGADAYTDIKLNGASTVTANTDLGAGDVVEFYLGTGDDSAKIDAIYATRYVLDKITGVDTKVKADDAEDGVTAYVTFRTLGRKNNTDIPGYNPDTYEKDAYVAVMANGSRDIVDSYIPEVVEDSVTTVKGSTEITVNGTKYTVAKGVVTGGDFVSAISSTNVKPGSDNTYALYLDNNGYVLAVKEIEGSAASLDEVYYIDNVWTDTKIVAGQSGKVYMAQLVSLADGTVSEVELEVKNHDLTSTKNDFSNTTDYTNDAAVNTALAGSLVTLSDDEKGSGANTSKENDKKFNLKDWSNDDYDVYTTVKFTTDDELKKDTVRITTNDSNNIVKNGTEMTSNGQDKVFRLNGSTQYVFLEGTKNTLDVTTATGGVAYTFSTANMGSAKDGIIITEKDKQYALYMVIPCDKADQDADYSEDMIYVAAVPGTPVKGDGYQEQEVYLPDGTKETWQIASGSKGVDKLAADKFYTYEQNDDGYYELSTGIDEDTAGKALKRTPSYVWKDEKGVATDAVIDSKDALADDHLLTVKVNTSVIVSDIEVGSAAFVDARPTTDGKYAAGQYEFEVSTLAALVDLLDSGNQKISEATLALNVAKDGAVTIFLTDTTAISDDASLTFPVSGSMTPTVASTSNTATITVGTVPTTGSTRNVVIGIEIANGKDYAANDQIAFSVTKGNANSTITAVTGANSTVTAQGAVVLKCTGAGTSNWQPLDIVVTAEDGTTTITYHVTVNATVADS